MKTLAIIITIIFGIPCFGYLLGIGIWVSLKSALMGTKYEIKKKKGKK